MLSGIQFKSLKIYDTKDTHLAGSLTCGVSRHLNDAFAFLSHLPRIEGADPYRHLHGGPRHGAAFLTPRGAFFSAGATLTRLPGEGPAGLEKREQIVNSQSGCERRRPSSCLPTSTPFDCHDLDETETPAQTYRKSFQV